MDVLAGVGPAVTKRLAALGLRTIGDLLRYRPRRYESAAPERRIADLFGDEDVAIAGEILSVSERRRGRLKILTARVAETHITLPEPGERRANGEPPLGNRRPDPQRLPRATLSRKLQ